MENFLYLLVLTAITKIFSPTMATTIMLNNNQTINSSYSSSNNNNNSNKTEASASDNFVELYSFPFILIIGTISNSFILMVMRRKKMRNQSTYFYMGVLAIADELVLLVGCLNFWVYVTTGQSFIFYSVRFLFFFNFLMNFSLSSQCLYIFLKSASINLSQL